jgi:hypothetical protein
MSVSTPGVNVFTNQSTRLWETAVFYVHDRREVRWRQINTRSYIALSKHV